MLSRRELIAAGVAGGLAAPNAADAAMVEVEQDREGQREIASQIQGIDSTSRLPSSPRRSVTAPSYVFGPKWKLFSVQIRSFDYFEVGIAVFFEIYDWHIGEQPIVVNRMADGKYSAAVHVLALFCGRTRIAASSVCRPIASRIRVLGANDSDSARRAAAIAAADRRL